MTTTDTSTSTRRHDDSSTRPPRRGPRRLGTAAVVLLATLGALLAGGSPAQAQTGGDGVVLCLHQASFTEMQRPVGGSALSGTRITEWLYRWNGSAWVYTGHSDAAVWNSYLGQWQSPQGHLIGAIIFDVPRNSGYYGITERIQTPTTNVVYSPIFYNYWEHTYNAKYCQG